MKKLPLEYQMLTKTYLKHTHLPTYATVVTVVTVHSAYQLREFAVSFCFLLAMI